MARRPVKRRAARKTSRESSRKPRTKLTRAFRGVLLAGHKGAAVEVPFDPATEWGIAATTLWKGRRGQRVSAKLNRIAFESAIVARSKRFWLLVDDDVLARAETSVGEDVALVIEPLVGPRAALGGG